MRNKSYLVFICLVFTFTSFAQTVDSTYIDSYKQKISIAGFVERNTIQLRKDGHIYEPNSPVSFGIRLGIRNTVIRFRYKLPVFTPDEDKYGETKAIDLQLHHFGKHVLYDVFFQRYEGFYSKESDDKDKIKIFPDMKLQQIGLEIAYLFNGNEFSAKAAFEQNEIQLQSAGSFVLGGSIYYYEVDPGTDLLTGEQSSFNNLILSFNGGYAYTWVMSRHWLMTGLASAGAGLGNETDELGDGDIEISPIAFARGALGYHKSGWGIDFSFLLHTKTLHYSGDTLNLTGIDFQLAFVKHLDRFF